MEFISTSVILRALIELGAQIELESVNEWSVDL
jgi:hypothetical protein